MTEEKQEEGINSLPQFEPATQKILNDCISEVVSEYVKETKYFTADTLHHIRARITHLAKQKLGDDVIESVDVILNLTDLEDIPMAFRIKVPKNVAEEHILNRVTLEKNE